MAPYHPMNIVSLQAMCSMNIVTLPSTAQPRDKFSKFSLLQEISLASEDLILAVSLATLLESFIEAMGAIWITFNSHTLSSVLFRKLSLKPHFTRACGSTSAKNTRL